MNLLSLHPPSRIFCLPPKANFSFFPLTSFCYFYFTATATRWQRGPWRTQPTIDWKWPKALRDYPVLLPDLGPGTTAAVPWISWNTFFTFTTWCCLYVPSIYPGARARKKGIFYFGDIYAGARALTQMKARGPWNLLSRFTRESLSHPTVLFALSDEVTLIQVSFFHPVYIVVDFPSRDVKSLGEQSTEAFIFPNFLLSIAYDSKLSKA